MINDFSTNVKVYITVKQEEGLHPFKILIMLYVIISRCQVIFVYVW